MSAQIIASNQVQYRMRRPKAVVLARSADRPAMTQAERGSSGARLGRAPDAPPSFPGMSTEPALTATSLRQSASDLNVLLDELQATRAEDPQVAQQLDYLNAEFEWESLGLQAQSAVVQLVGRRADILDSAVPVKDTSAAERPTNSPAKPDPVLQNSPKAKLQALRQVLRDGLDGYVDMEVIETLRSNMRKLGWDGSDHASLYALLALDPANESEQSTLMALAWFCASIGAHWKGTNGDPVVEALAAFRDFDELGKKVKTYLRAHFDPELQKEMGIAAGYCPRPHPAVQIGNPQ